MNVISNSLLSVILTVLFYNGCHCGLSVVVACGVAVVAVSDRRYGRYCICCCRPVFCCLFCGVVFGVDVSAVCAFGVVKWLLFPL